MSVVLNINKSASVDFSDLANSGDKLKKSLNRLSSGLRIVNPADDAGGLAVLMKIGATANRQGAVNSQIGNAVSMLQTQDGALKLTGKILDRISELRTLNEDVTKNSSDKANYNTEFVALKGQLSSITAETFNGIAMFGSTTSTVNVTEDDASSSQITLGARDLSSISSGVGAITAASSLSAISGAAIVTSAIENVATMRATNGAEQSRLSIASELLITNKANLEAASSRISDVDLAWESTQFAMWNTLVSAGISSLSQDKQNSQVALRLLQ